VKVGDLVMLKPDLKWPNSEDRFKTIRFLRMPVGIITHIDPEDIGDSEEVLVLWNDGEGYSNHSMYYLEVISESR